MGPALNFREQQERKVFITVAGILQTHITGGNYLPTCLECVCYWRHSPPPPQQLALCWYLGTGSTDTIMNRYRSCLKSNTAMVINEKYALFSHGQMFCFGLYSEPGSSETYNLFIQFIIQDQCNSQ